MNRLILTLSFILLLLISSSQLKAFESAYVTASGEATLANCTPEEAQDLALRRARLNAIEAVCGVKLQAETFVKDFTVQSDFIHAVSYGNIVSEEIIRWNADVLQNTHKLPPVVTYRVSIKAQVVSEKGEPDPSYKVKVRLNKTVYQSGDEMIIHVKATKPSYITVLNFCADDRVIILFPNQIRRDNKISQGVEYQIPTEADRDGILKLRVSTLPGHKKDNEFIKIVATQKPINLLDEFFVSGQYGSLQTINLAVTEIAKAISAIPVKDRSEDTVAYQIVSEE